jgi:hypothetical protein
MLSDKNINIFRKDRFFFFFFGVCFIIDSTIAKRQRTISTHHTGVGWFGEEAVVCGAAPIAYGFDGVPTGGG